ncbi:H-type small acid-soluble spore protein [Clostridium sp. CX1]|uniref:Small, acid-soluble spore protein H n=1 Tax=Clostridium tanneri TaxID=3037988 RepID=A0ABU4JTK2_9CLOT|nr:MULTISPECIES: H-type small acid-soluble spore protein [unclassified Clostridium]MCT8977923.1 H-type small acid-soluble spore protein [Clostridium sp. CX1]MDW8801487.1 H-type small acid-soluble spore protein [Clostridium sp. A1-XYC3]
MDIERANEIVSSPDMANVTYDGAPVYIQNVNQGKKMAYIYPLNQPDKLQEVPVDSLVEY